MDKKLLELISHVKKFKLADGFNDTPIPSFKIIQSTHTYSQVQSVYKPSLCVILQGAKTVLVGDKTLSYKPGEYIFCSVEVPVTGNITKASVKEPYLCLCLEIEPSMVFDVLKEIPITRSQGLNEKSGAYKSKVASPIYDAFGRLITILNKPEDMSFFSKMILKEILYLIFQDDYGDIVKQMGIAGSQTQRISSAIEILKKKFKTSINIEELAQQVGMSPSSFHKHFKEITNMSPLQYQKLIRLQEPRGFLWMRSVMPRR